MWQRRKEIHRKELKIGFSLFEEPRYGHDIPLTSHFFFTIIPQLASDFFSIMLIGVDIEGHQLVCCIISLLLCGFVHF